MRVGAVDCGTNSIRLLVADVETDAETGVPTLTEVLRRTEVVRLGQGVDRTGYLDQAALARTIDMAAQYAQLCREHEVAPGAVRFVATSASRTLRPRFGAVARSCSAGVCAATYSS